LTLPALRRIFSSKDAAATRRSGAMPVRASVFPEKTRNEGIEKV
jgi:hypothetical protein